MLVSRTKSLCSDPLCLNTIEELQTKLRKIQQLNVLIREECNMRELNRRHHMMKRSYDAPLNVIGNIAHSLFGTLDNKYADKMEVTLANVKSNADRLLLLIKNHTTVIDQTVKIIQNNNKEVSQKIQELHTETITLAATQKKDSKRILFNSLVNYASIAMNEYRETQLQLHKMMIDFKKRKLNPFLISPVELETHIHELEHVLGARYKLPSTHYAELETVVQLAVVHGNSCLMFQIEIPLLRHENFELYRMVPVPTFEGDKYQFIKPTDDFLAIDKRRQFYYLLDESEFKSCTQFYEIKLCYQNQALYPANDDNHCEINLFLDSNQLNHCDLRQGIHHAYWIALQELNHWLFAVKNKVQAKITCEPDKTLFESITLMGEGILEINPSCTLDAPGIRIPGKSIVHSNLFLKTIPWVLPRININESTVFKNSTKPLLLKLNNLESISTAIQQAKEDEAVELKPVLFEDGPDVYHSIGISGLLLLCCVLLFAYLTCCKKKIPQPIVNVKNEVPRSKGRFSLPKEEIELDEFV